MRIAYFHGLESNVDPGKLNILKKYGPVLAPEINYIDNLKSIADELFQQAKDFKPTLIVGSSLGAYTAYHIGNKLNCNLILFNPPLYGPTVNLSISKNTSNTNNIIIYQGKNDNVVSPYETEKWLMKNHKGKFTIIKYDGEHRVPTKVFKDALNTNHISENKFYVQSYNEFIQ